MSRLRVPPFKVSIDYTARFWPKKLAVSVETPLRGAICEAYSVEIGGFIAPVEGSGLKAAKEILFLVEGTELWSCPINISRSDVLGAPSEMGMVDPDCVQCGFNTILPSFLSSRPEPILMEVYLEPDDDGRVIHFTLGLLSFEEIDDQQRQRSQSSDIGVIIVNSMGRSGSSLMCRVLYNHPAFVVPRLLGQYGEVSILGHYLRSIAVISNEGALSELNRLDMFADFLTLPVGYFKTDAVQGNDGPELGARLLAMNRRMSEDMFRLALAEVALYAKEIKPGVQYWVEKSWNLTATNIGRGLVVNWKEIVLVRHIRAFWRSQTLFHRKIGSSEDTLKQHTDATVDKYILMARTVRDRRDDIHLVQYEDMMQNTADVLDGIFGFLSISFTATDRKWLEAIVHESDQESQAMATQSADSELDQEFDRHIAALTPAYRELLALSLGDLGYRLDA